MIEPAKRQAPLNIFEQYFEYVSDTEPPLVFHRWSMVGCIGAALGKRFWLPFGANRIFPNMYIMLMGSPGSRKSTAIKSAQRILRGSGYESFSANKTSKEKFLLDLEGKEDDVDSAAGDGKNSKDFRRDSEIFFRNVFGDGSDASGYTEQDIRETFVVADEFNEFVGSGNIEFLSLLGALWDWDDPSTLFTYRLKNSKSVAIYQPTISILSGNTHAGFQEAFPPQAIGQGFLSRLLLVFSEPSGRRISFPSPPPDKLRDELVASFATLRQRVTGPASLADDAKRALDIIYRSWQPLEDTRFSHYSTRRFTHLLKLCLVTCAARGSTNISLRDVLFANTLLSFTELSMPKALGEFGKSKHSEAAHKIMSALYDTKKPLTLQELWKIVNNDLEKMQQLSDLLGNLASADKIQVVNKQGFLPKQRKLDTKQLYVDFTLLKEAEK